MNHRHNTSARRPTIAVALWALVLGPSIAMAQPGPKHDDGREAGPRAAPPDRPDVPLDDPVSGPEAPDGDLDDPAQAQQQIDDAVARSLLERAENLFADGNHAGAKTLVIESLERSPRGPVADSARALLRKCNQQLGISNLDDGLPAVAGGAGGAAAPEPDPTSGNQPLDPYATAEDETVDPLDPYGDADPDANGGAGAAGKDPPDTGERDAGDWRKARRDLMLFGGAYGVTAGLALAGPNDDAGETSGGAMLAGLVGAGAGMLLGYAGASRYRPSEGQAALITSGGVWGGVALGFFSDVITGIDSSDENDIYKGVAIGGLVGSGGGVALSRVWDPSVGDVALTNSLGIYGGVGGLLLAVAIDPPETEAYSLNAIFGTAIGLGAGMLAARKYETTRRRMLWVDVGALIGAAGPWVLLYPLFADDAGRGDEQAAGVLSTVGLVGGAFTAWYLTRDMDAKAEEDGAATAEIGEPPVPALIQRSSTGTWGVGVPAFVPAVNPALAPPAGSVAERGVAATVLGGRF